MTTFLIATSFYYYRFKVLIAIFSNGKVCNSNFFKIVFFNSSGFMDVEGENLLESIICWRRKKIGENYEWGQLNSGLVELVDISVAQNWRMNHHDQSWINSDINITLQIIYLSLYHSNSKLEKEEKYLIDREHSELE